MPNHVLALERRRNRDFLNDGNRRHGDRPPQMAENIERVIVFPQLVTSISTFSISELSRCPENALKMSFVPVVCALIVSVFQRLAVLVVANDPGVARGYDNQYPSEEERSDVFQIDVPRALCSDRLDRGDARCCGSAA